MRVAKPKATAPAAKRGGLFFAALLAVILAVLFWKSFVPGYVHFSNDGPLAQQETAWAKLPGAFHGIWSDLNDIGNSGGSLGPDLGTLFRWLVGPVGYAKFLPPYALFILGLGAWTFFRQMKFSPLAAILGGLAAALNSAFFSTACWGVAAQQIAIGFAFFALALIVSNTPETPALTCWVRWVLAGLAVGLDVMHGADVGAIFSVFIAAFVVVRTLAVESGAIPVKLARGVGRVAVIAVFAGVIAAQTIVSLVGSSISGIAGTAQNEQTKAKQWNWATEWSQPKIETLAVFVPGLFGYKLDTPVNMEMFPNAFRGGNYWGAVGRDPVLDQFFAHGMKGTPPPHQFMRQTGGGPYAGILVVLIAIWAIAQSWRRRNSVFTEPQRRMLWFWTAVLGVSLLLCWGRFAPFYALLYQLPYASLVRNPTKFLLVFSWALVIVFGYGVDGLSRRYLQAPAANFKSSLAQLQSWWKNVRGFDRRWAVGCLIAFGACLLAWLVYWTQKAVLVKYLQSAYEQGSPKDIAAFSIASAGWFLPFFAAAIGLVLLISAGIFSGKRARLGGFLLGALLLADLGRANLPWLVYWNYPQKYASNPIIDILRHKPYEHRVFRLRSQSLFEDLYDIEWVQQLFPYYNIQSLNLVMRPRVGSDLEAYETDFLAASEDESYRLAARHWQLTNGRYFLGPANYLAFLNQKFDPVQHRFHIVQRFKIAAKPGVEQATQLSELTAVPDNNGPYALIEFTGALPRARLYRHWQWPKNDQAAAAELTPANLGTNGWALLQRVGTNDFLTLKELVSPSFDPWKTVLLADSPAVPPPPAATTNENTGTVDFTSYSPKDIKLHTQASTPTVLLLNDQYDPHWRVTVDGKPAPLLRANFIMRGVYLPAGAHSVEFRFRLPVRPLYVTVSAMVLGILLCGFLFYLEHKPRHKPPANGIKSA